MTQGNDMRHFELLSLAIASRPREVVHLRHGAAPKINVRPNFDSSLLFATR